MGAPTPGPMGSPPPIPDAPRKGDRFRLPAGSVLRVLDVTPSLVFYVDERFEIPLHASHADWRNKVIAATPLHLRTG